MEKNYKISWEVCFLNIWVFFSDSAYRKYLTATYSYDYENGGGMDYDQIPAANPGTTAMTTAIMRQTIPTNYPLATREDSKAVLFRVSIFLVSYGWGWGAFFLHFLCRFYVDFMWIHIQKGFFFFNSNHFVFVQILDNYNCNGFSKCYLVNIGNNA